MSTTYAPRFSLTLPLRFRKVGDPEWVTAATRNLSSSGVLFFTQQPLQPGTELELEIVLNEALALHASRIRARGGVVRQSFEDGSGWLTAVHYADYKLERTAS